MTQQTGRLELNRLGQFAESGEALSDLTTPAVGLCLEEVRPDLDFALRVLSPLE